MHSEVADGLESRIGKKPRRTAVAGHPAVYYRVGANGKRRYEISFRDSEGRRRWKVIDGGLREAEEALDEIRGRIRRGERVAPSKATLREIAESWLEAQTQLRSRTLERYRGALECHVFPRFGHLRVAELTEDHVSQLIAEMRAGVHFRRERMVRDPHTRKLVPDTSSRLVRVKRATPFAGWTIRAVLTPLSRVMAHAVRRGMAAANPVAKLERGERPAVSRREMRVLEPDEIESLLGVACERYRPLLATAVFTGLRLGELLGLVWADVDFEGGLIKVRKQLARTGERVEPKTPQAVRDVVLMPALGRVLREHKLRTGYSQPTDFVFPSLTGTPLQARNVARRALGKATAQAELHAGGRRALRFHDMRHTFASLLIAEGLDVVFVSRQLGHANPSITLSIYAHLFDRARHAERTRDALETSFGALVEAVARDSGRSAGVAAAPDIVALPGFGN
jgi:integrase